MKMNLNRTLTLTAAVLSLSAAAAYGQNTATANIPFPFRTTTGVQAAGHYAVSPASANGVVTLRNLETLEGTFLGFGIADDDAKSASPQLVFRCGSESGCALSSIRMVDGRVWKYSTPHLKPSELERVAVINLERKQSE